MKFRRLMLTVLYIYCTVTAMLYYNSENMSISKSPSVTASPM